MKVIIFFGALFFFSTNGARAEGLPLIYGKYQSDQGCRTLINEIGRGSLRVVVAMDKDSLASRAVVDIPFSRLKFENGRVLGEDKRDGAISKVDLRLDSTGRIVSAKASMVSLSVFGQERRCKNLKLVE